MIDECTAGDPAAAAERLAVVTGVELLATTEAVEVLAGDLVAQGAIPASQPRDALHIAIAAVNGVDTWRRGTSSTSRTPCCKAGSHRSAAKAGSSRP